MKKDHQKNNLQSFEKTKAYFLFISGLFMAMVHLDSVFFSYGDGYYQTPMVETIFYYSRFLAYFNITIPCVAAMTYLTVYLQNQHKPNFKFEYLKILLKLFFILFLVENAMEIIMNLSNLNLEFILNLDFYSFAVLQFTGLSLILLHLIVNFMGIYHLIGFGLLSLFSAPWLFEFFRSKGFYILSGSNNYEFQWPLIPWLVIPFFGFLVSLFWIKYPKYKTHLFGLTTLIFIILFYWVKDRVSVQLNTRWGDAVFQPDTLLVMQNLLLVPMLLFISEKVSELRLLKRFDLVDVISRGILVFYLSHVLISEFVLINIINKKFITEAVGSLSSLNHILLLAFMFICIYLILLWVSVQITKLYLIFFVDYKFSKVV